MGIMLTWMIIGFVISRKPRGFWMNDLDDVFLVCLFAAGEIWVRMDE